LESAGEDEFKLYGTISFGAVTETGGLLLGDEIKINANVQFVKQAVAELV